MSRPQYSKAQSTFLQFFDRASIEQLARDTGLTKRMRSVRPFELLMALVSSLGSEATCLADIHRAYNAQTGEHVAYKAFHNQLSKQALEPFIEALARQALDTFMARVFDASIAGLRQFDDVLVQDGTCFRVHDALADLYPRRFGHWGGVAGVELHATMSLRCDQLSSLDITADTVSERSRLPQPESLRGKLLLADRGYFDVAYVNQVAACGGHVLQRVQQANPIVEVVRINGRRIPVLDGVELVTLLSAARDAVLDLDVSWPRKQVRLRIVSFSPPGAETRTTLITSLPRSQFSAAQLGQLYRLRWQIEILFKALKSFARLGRWNTRKESLTRALIWGSVLVMTLKRFLAHRAVPTGVVASTLSAAKALPLVLGDVLLAMIRRRSITAPFRRMMRFLGAHAPRAHPNRDLRQGRLACGLRAAAA